MRAWCRGRSYGPVRDLIGGPGSSRGCLPGHPKHSGFEECVDSDQLTAAREQSSRLTLCPLSVELVLSSPPCSTACRRLSCGQRVTGAGQGPSPSRELCWRAKPSTLRRTRPAGAFIPPFRFSFSACLVPYHFSLFSFLSLIKDYILKRWQTAAALIGEFALKRLDTSSAPALRDGRDLGSGENLLFPFFQAVADAYGCGLSRASVGEARFLSCPRADVRTAWTVTPWPAQSALSDCVN